MLRPYHQGHFSWVEDLKPITDKGHINEFEFDLIGELHTLPLEKWSLLSPYPEESPAMYYKLNKAKTKYPSLEDVQQVLVEKIKEGTNLKKIIVRPFDSRDESLRSWNAYKGLLYEKATKAGTYILVGGTWYLVDVGCINTLDRDINKLFLTNPHPLLDRLTALTPGEAAKGTRDNPNKREQKYNIRMAEENPEHFLLMDARNASLEKGNSNDVVEVCDLLSPERYLIHVKNWTGSGTFSHLLNQGLSSANMLLDPSYRRKAQHQFMRAEILEYLHPSFEDPSHKEGFASKLKVIFDNSETSEEEKLSASIKLIEEYFGAEVMGRKKIEELNDIFTKKKIQFERGLPPIDFNPSHHTIVYAFFHKDNYKTLNEYLPIFSRLALREISHCLKSLGYTNILVKKIDYPASESQKGKGRKTKTAPKKSASSSSSTSQASSSSSSARSQG
ncbi:hypothetical protein IM40_10735 (plasmid) [Candidatus Paracaedimonas acanthamoebae]|nr:hypothetical protein IM40_10735 [Candidatus Paracaedimonas acanthamoebae]